MSGFLLVMDRAGAPVDEASIEAGLVSIADPGSTGRWHSVPRPWLALGESVRRDTPEVPAVPRPYSLGDCTLAGDIRLDNREDLIAALGVSDPDCPDADLILLAYRAWGADCVRRLFGEFAFVLWDDGAQRLLAARDPMGERALYVAEAGRQLLLSNQIRALRGWPGVADALDEVTLAGMVARRGLFMREPERTFYAAIKQLPPGHFTLFGQGSQQKHCYWSITELADQPLSGRSLDSLREEFTALLGDAVAKRLRSAKPVGSQLSGGLDSTTVACLAAGQLRGRGQTLHCFSHLTRDPIPDISATRTVRDEAYINAAAEQYPNIIQHWAYGDERDLLSDVVEHFHYTGVIHPNHYQTWWDEISKQAQALGIGTMLTGGSGNMTASWNGIGAQPSPVRRAKLGIRRMLETLRGAGDINSFGALRSDVATRLGLQDRAREVTRHLQQQPRAGILSRGFSGLFRAYPIGRFDIELRDPLGDWRVVEFCLRAPVELFRRGDERRLLLRDTLRGIVPDLVLDRQSRQLQAADWIERTRSQRPLLMERLDRLARNDAVNSYLDLAPVRAQFDQLPVDRGDMPSLTRWNDKVLHPLAVASVLEWISQGSPRP